MVALAFLTIASGADTGDIRLPDMGSPADAILSKSDEAQIGRQIMLEFRKSGQVIEDPQVDRKSTRLNSSH